MGKIFLSFFLKWVIKSKKKIFKKKKKNNRREKTLSANDIR